jgi:hypothetical protein
LRATTEGCDGDQGVRPGDRVSGRDGTDGRSANRRRPGHGRSGRGADIAQGKGTPARARLYIDGKLAGQGDLPVTIPLDIGIADGLSCGRDEGSTITSDYRGPFAFTGGLEKIVVDVSGELVEDHDAQMRSVMAHQ